MFSKDDISMPIHLPQVILGWLLLFYNIPQKAIFLSLHRMRRSLSRLQCYNCGMQICYLTFTGQSRIQD